MIAVGETAPDFCLKDSENNEFYLSDFKGRYVLLLFYPKDHGFFCTKQFCEYRNDWQKFEERKIQVLGINSGSPEAHKDFKDAHSLPFPLLSDPDYVVTSKFGAQSVAGFTMRAYVLITPENEIIYSYSELFPMLRKSLNDLIKIIDSRMSTYENDRRSESQQ